MRSNILLVLLISIFSSSVSAQEASRPPAADCVQKADLLLQEAFTLMKQHYYRKDSVQWDQLLTAARTKLHSSPDCAAAQQALQWCFQEMKERHSFVMPAKKAEAYNGNINSAPGVPQQVAGTLRNELVEAGIAYIDVPWISSADKTICTAFADSLQMMIADYDRKGVTKWIIDLRNNTGGNCWPMLAGLGPLLGNGVHGFFVSKDEKIPFSYQDGSVLQGRHIRCTTTYPYTLSTAPRTIIILTGPNTASAGEIVAIAFKGRNNVFLYGQPTAGLTTANATYKLSDGSLLVLTVCKEADRYGNIFEGKIHPDRLITSAPGKDVAKSEAVMFLQVNQD